MRGLRTLATAALVCGLAGPALAQTSGLLPPGTLLGGVPTGVPATGALDLSLHDAIQRALEHNLGVVLGQLRVRSADGARWLAMSGLLPTVGAHVAQSRDQINLEAYGFPVAPGQSPIIGPFSISDRRISVVQALFDLSAIQTARAGSAMKTASELGYQDLREQVVVVIANLYFQAVATTSRIESA
ncbi:MAG: TolC family protein, partial [Acidobacteria bacterium]|nr:TolC family protein [Acidobacteriota bacterium]